MGTDILQALRSIRILAPLPDPFLQRLAAYSVLRNVRSGETIFCQGEPSPYCFGIVSGEVKIQRVSRNRRFPSKVLSVLTPGDIFGESSLFEESPRSAMASASQDGELVAILGAKFRAGIQQDAVTGVPLLMALLQNGLAHLRQTSRELSVVYGMGRLLGTPAAFKDQLAEAMEFLRSSLDGVDEVFCYERSLYWDEFQACASAPCVVGLPTLPAQSALIADAKAARGPFAVGSPELRQAVKAAQLPWEHSAAIGVVPLLDIEKSEDPLQGLILIASYQRSDLFTPNSLSLLAAVAQPLSEALARYRRQEDLEAQSRLRRSQRSFGL